MSFYIVHNKSTKGEFNMKIIVNETITYERELTQEEEFLILSTVKM